MKKAEQRAINEEVYRIMRAYDAEYRHIQNKSGERLRWCSAEVIKGDNGYWLRSYRTIIAFIPYLEYGFACNPCYDFLRAVYGYTATSAQHISKFASDYGNGKVLSYKEV